MYYQYKLATRRGLDKVYMTCWIEHDHKLSVGNRLTLKDYPHDSLWTVQEVYNQGQDNPAKYQSWKVGGLY